MSDVTQGPDQANLFYRSQSEMLGDDELLSRFSSATRILAAQCPMFDEDVILSITTEEIEALRIELTNRLALRDQQVTLAMCLEAVDTGVVFDDEITDMNVRDVRRILESVHRALAALWEATPQQDGAE